MDKHFSLVSQKTRDALKEEGRFTMMFPLVYHVDAPSISTFSTRFHNIGKVKGNTSHTVVLKDHIGPVVSQNDLSFQNHFEG